MLINMTFAFVIVVTSVVAALISLILISVLQGRKAARPRLADPTPQIEGTVFLFDDQELVDATGPARALLDATPLRGGDWARLSAFLAPRFDRFEARMATLAEYGTIEMTAKGDSRLHLVAEHLGGMARITLSDPQTEGQEIVIDPLSHRALEDEVSALRTTVDAAPILVWREDAQGAVIWANRAYLLQSGALEDEEGLRWPLPTLFDASLRAVSPGTARRLKIDRKPGEKPLWFECHAFPATEGTLHFALPCDAAVNAEVSLREFVQTLTKTFAHLPIGLAIFDRNRQLALFNPALMDLTTISPEFLTARPTLFAFLDRIARIADDAGAEGLQILAAEDGGSGTGRR